MIKKVPVFGPIMTNIYQKWIHPPQPFSDSRNYWIHRYEANGNSGTGSYGRLARFKAEVLNKFVREENIKTIIEFGSGDGNQLKLAEYPSYIGFDVSQKSNLLCRKIFSRDRTKTFKLIDEYHGEKSQITLSLDVIYHLVEDDVYDEYMHRLFNASEMYVIIYSSNTNENSANQVAHIKHRKFSQWIEEKKPEWQLFRHIPNQYPFNGDSEVSSFADFYIYQKPNA